MFPVPIVPGTLPLVGHRVTSSHNKSSAPVGLHRYSTLATRTCAQGGRAAAHHGCTRGIACARRAHTQACAALGPSLPVVPPTWRLLNGKDRQGGVEVEELQQRKGDPEAGGIGKI